MGSSLQTLTLSQVGLNQKETDLVCGASQKEGNVGQGGYDPEGVRRRSAKLSTTPNTVRKAGGSIESQQRGQPSKHPLVSVLKVIKKEDDGRG